MNDADIIKAKELLKKLEEAYNAYYDTSKSMPYDIDKTIRETAICLENAITEINRQKSEIERLNIYANDLLMLLSPKNERSEAKTYSDVIKAFERCSCSAMFDALDVNLRQAAEIERLQKDIDIIQSANVELYSALDKARTEATTEFAERLKGVYINDKRYDRPNAHTMIIKLFDNIDQIAKKMKGEQ